MTQLNEGSLKSVNVTAAQWDGSKWVSVEADLLAGIGCTESHGFWWADSIESVVKILDDWASCSGRYADLGGDPDDRMLTVTVTSNEEPCWILDEIRGIHQSSRDCYDERITVEEAAEWMKEFERSQESVSCTAEAFAESWNELVDIYNWPSIVER